MGLFNKNIKQDETNTSDEIKNDVETDASDDSFDDIIAEKDLESKTVKPNIIDKMKSNDKITDTITFCKDNRKSLIITACLILLLIIVYNIANAIVFADGNTRSDLKGQRYNLIAEYNKIKNDMDVFEKTNPYYTKVDNSELENQNKNVNWIGDKTDEGRWRTDDAYFWTWIEPAFNYDSATEYNENAREFITTKDLPEDHLFVVAFLPYYDYTNDLKYDVNNNGLLDGNEIGLANQQHKSQTNKSLYKTWPIGKTEDGDYHYLAIVPKYVGSAYGEAKYWINSFNNFSYVMFTFTVEHNINIITNSDTMKVSDFNVWPLQTY